MYTQIKKTCSLNEKRQRHVVHRVRTMFIIAQMTDQSDMR